MKWVPCGLSRVLGLCGALGQAAAQSPQQQERSGSPLATAWRLREYSTVLLPPGAPEVETEPRNTSPPLRAALLPCPKVTRQGHTDLPGSQFWIPSCCHPWNGLIVLPWGLRGGSQEPTGLGTAASSSWAVLPRPQAPGPALRRPQSTPACHPQLPGSDSAPSSLPTGPGAPLPNSVAIVKGWPPCPFVTPGCPAQELGLSGKLLLCVGGCLCVPLPPSRGGEAGAPG